MILGGYVKKIYFSSYEKHSHGPRWGHFPSRSGSKETTHLKGRLQPGVTQDLMPGGQCSRASVLSDDGEGLFSAQNPGPFNKVKASSCQAEAGGSAGCLLDQSQGKRKGWKSIRAPSSLNVPPHPQYQLKSYNPFETRKYVWTTVCLLN